MNALDRNTIAALLQSLPPDDIATVLIKSMPPIDLLRIADMSEATHLSSLSSETLLRDYARWVITLSARRKGMRVIHALMAGQLKNAA